MADDLYEILGVDPKSPEAQIRAAYRDAVRRLHPDHTGGGGPDHATFTAIVDAWTILGDPRTRAEYDAGRRSSVAGGGVQDTAAPVVIDPRSSRQIRWTFTVAIIIVASMTLVLFVVGMSQSGGG